MWTVTGMTLSFEVTVFDPGRQWSWTVAGVPATGHRVDPTPGGCRVCFDVPWWAWPYLSVCAVALGRIDRLATEGQRQ